MKPQRTRKTTRVSGSVLIAGLLLFATTLPADIMKGAGKQRDLTRNQRVTATSAPAKTAPSSSASRPTPTRATDEIVITTGSQIPKASRKQLPITDGAQNLQAFDRKRLERTGAVNITEAVRRLVP